METSIGNFKGLKLINDGVDWNLKIALKFFYLYIIPVGTNKGDDANDVRARLVSWISKGKRGRWENHPNFTFDLDTFNQINKQAVDILLDTTLVDLNQNRYFDSEKPKEKLNFTEPSLKTTDKETGDSQETVFNFGINFGKNEKGLNVKDNKKYQEIRNLIIAAKNELEALKVQQGMAMGTDTIGAWAQKIDDVTKALTKNTKMLEDLKKPMYDDDITLRQVVNNQNVKSFYSVGGNPSTVIGEDTEAKVALAILREVVSRNLSENEYEELYGGDDLSFEEFKKVITEKEEEYFKLLKIPFQIQQKLVGISKETDKIQIAVDREKLVQENQPEKSLSDLADVTHFPIKMTDQPDIENKEDLLNFVRTRKDTNQIDRLLDRVLTKYSKDVLEPLFKIRTDITIETTSFEERQSGDLEQLPVKMSKDTIEEFILDKVVDINNIKYPKFERAAIDKPKEGGKEGETERTWKTKMSMFYDTNKNKFKMPIEFKGLKMDFESGYAKTVLAGSRNAISGEKQIGRKLNKEGTVVINSKGIPIPKTLFKKLPGLGAEADWVYLRNTMTNYYGSSGASTIEERIEKKIKTKITPSTLDKLSDAISLIKEIDDIQKNSDVPNIFDLRGYRKRDWLTSTGRFKYTLNQFRAKLAGKEEIKEGNMLKSIQKMILILAKIIEYVEVNDKDIDEAYAEIEESEDTEIAGEQANLRDIKERDEDEDTNRQALERGLDPKVQEFEGEFALDLESGSDKITERNEELLEVLKDFKDDGLEEIDNIKDTMSNLRQELLAIGKSKGVNIKSNDFVKAFNEWADTTSYPEPEILLGLIKEVDEDKEPEEQVENKNSVKAERMKMEEHWKASKESEEFQVPTPEIFVEMIHHVKLGKVLSEILAEDKLFNNARNGLVTASSNKLRIELDYKAKKLYVKGQIKWESARESHLGFKIEGSNKERQMSTHSTMTPTQKKLGGKKITGKGRIQDDRLIGQTQDKLRYDFLKEVQNKMKVLQGAI